MFTFLGMMHRTMLAVKVDDTIPPSNVDVLIIEIAMVGKQLAKLLHSSGRSPERGVIRQRNSSVPEAKMKLWRIHYLSRPLWLGRNGVIYRGYRSGWSGIPTFWMRAELEKRNEAGLQHVLTKLTKARNRQQRRQNKR